MFPNSETAFVVSSRVKTRRLFDLIGVDKCLIGLVYFVAGAEISQNIG